MRQGPAWLGIGAQRSGTTWFTDLLLQHPEVRLSARPKKELHRLYRTMNAPFNAKKYLRLFKGPGYPGEFTPFYMRALWAPAVAREVVSSTTPIIVLLRDPIDRFESAMRMQEQTNRPRKRKARINRPPSRMVRWRMTDSQWAGMYATQLDCWAASFERHQFVVLQYETLRKDPQAAVNLVWERLGIEPVALQKMESPSRTLTQGLVEWEWPPGLKDALRMAYQPEVDRLVKSWEVDASLWRNF